MLGNQNAEQFINPESILQHVGVIEGTIIADLGCGGGYMVIPAAKMTGDTGMVYAVDIQKHVLENILGKSKQEGIQNISTVWADLEILGSTKIPADSCDLVLLANTLYQSKQPAEMVEEAKRILKPGGRLVIFDWKQANIPIGPQVDHRIPEADVVNIANSKSLELLDKFEPSQYHYGLVYTK